MTLEQLLAAVNAANYTPQELTDALIILKPWLAIRRLDAQIAAKEAQGITSAQGYAAELSALRAQRQAAEEAMISQYQS